MTASAVLAMPDPETPEDELDDAAIQAKAWAMAEGVADSLADRVTLLHAAAMLKAMLAVNQPDPILAVSQMLQEHCTSTLEMTERALTMMDQPADTTH